MGGLVTRGKRVEETCRNEHGLGLTTHSERYEINDHHHYIEQVRRKIFLEDSVSTARTSEATVAVYHLPAVLVRDTTLHVSTSWVYRLLQNTFLGTYFMRCNNINRGRHSATAHWSSFHYQNYSRLLHKKPNQRELEAWAVKEADRHGL